MSDVGYRHDEGRFELRLPGEWGVEADGEGGLLISREKGAGLLHLMPFGRDAQEELDPAEELYAFLEDQDIELEEDEVEDIALRGDGDLAICEYVAEEADETVYWLVGVATAPGRLVFASYSCEAGEEEQEGGTIRQILSTIRFLGSNGEGSEEEGAS